MDYNKLSTPTRIFKNEQKREEEKERRGIVKDQ